VNLEDFEMRERERDKFSGRKRDVLKNETLEEHFGQFGGFFFE
jgi:hypothetical protein